MAGADGAHALSFLVLLSGEFPAQRGDYSFIRHEISALADRFDRVLVYSFRPLDGLAAPLPGNVVHVGALTELPRHSSLLALLKPASAKAVLRAVRLEARSGRMRSHVPAVLGNVLTGARFARAIESALSSAGASDESDVAVYSFWGSHGALALPLLPARFHKIVRLHRFDLYEGAGARLPLRASIFGSVDALLSISEDGRRYLDRHFGDLIPSGKLSVARLGTTDHGVGPVPAPLADRGAEDPIRVVTCSSIIDVKRVSSLIPALELLAREHPVMWTHFGDGPLMPELRLQAREAEERTSHLRIDLRGQAENSTVLAHYRETAVDVFVNVSDSEGVPVSIMEALSFGIPVVATDVGGTGEIVNSELGSGLLVPPRPEPARLAAALQEVVRQRSSLRPRTVWEQLSDSRATTARVVDALR